MHHTMHLWPGVAKQPNLELKTRPKQLLGSIPLVIVLPAEAYWAQVVKKIKCCESRTLTGMKMIAMDKVSSLPYFIEYSVHFFYMENDAEIFPVHYTWKVTEKGFNMASIMNELEMINTCEINLEKLK
jgi:hypothetical protein